MQDLAYEYMNWPRIEALVYAEEQSPRDVMAPRITKDGVLVQGFFPGADSASVVAKGKEYPAVCEDEAGYVSVTEGLITVEGDTAKCGSSRYSLSSIINDIAAQRSVLAMPAQSFYYNDAASLAAACDDIVLCRVVSVEGPKPTQCRSFVKGESISSTANLLYVTVLVENSFGGERAYGDTMVIALSPALTRSVINAGDLSAISYSSPIKLPQEGEHYIFFLTRSEDAKSDIRFAVNPYQGYVELEGDSVIRPYYNKAIEGVRSLGELAGIINSAIGF